MSRFIGFVFAACLFAIWTSTTVPAANPDWPKALTLATASPGGIFYVYGEAVAEILRESVKIEVNLLPTQGSTHNVKLVESGVAELGFITLSNGAWINGREFRNIRALFPMYDNINQTVVLAQSGITNWAQLNGKRIGVGPPSGNGGVYGPAVFKTIGISPQLSYGSFDKMAIALLDGSIDALLAQGGAPFPAIQQVEAKAPIRFLSFSAEQIEAIRKVVPEFGASKIPAGTYRLLEEDYVSIGMFNFAIGRNDLPDDQVYQLVKAVFDNQPRLLKTNSAARETVPQNVQRNTFLPFHPGAVRYYREIGIKIPDALVPTN